MGGVDIEKDGDWNGEVTHGSRYGFERRGRSCAGVDRSVPAARLHGSLARMGASAASVGVLFALGIQPLEDGSLPPEAAATYEDWARKSKCWSPDPPEKRHLTDVAAKYTNRLCGDQPLWVALRHIFALPRSHQGQRRDFRPCPKRPARIIAAVRRARRPGDVGTARSRVCGEPSFVSHGRSPG